MSREGAPRKEATPSDGSLMPEPSLPESAEQNPEQSVTPEQYREKLRAVIVNMDRLREQAARDSAERAMTASAESMAGVSGFLKRIWTHTLAREYYRQKHLSEARTAIDESQNLYGAEFEHPAGREAHEATASALIGRFTQEYEETLHAGETRRLITREGAGELDVRGEIMALMRSYAAGGMSDDDFAEAKKQILHTVGRIEGSKDDSMYADNLLEIARTVKQAVDHGIAVDALDLDLDVVLGNARDSIQTEANYNVVDRAIEAAKRSPLGVLVNESTLASGIAIAAGTVAAFSKRVAGSRLAAVGTFGATAVLSGGLIGYAENKRTKEERSQHAREMAQGRTYERGASPRREEMDNYIHEMREARQLASAILEAKDEAEKISAIADAEARIRLMDREHIDLLSYSDPAKVEQERLQLDLARAQAKAELRKRPAGAGKSFDEMLNDLVDVRCQGLMKDEGGIEERDRLFNKMKTKRVANAAVKGVCIGLAVGTVAQEAAAFFNDEQTGLAEHLAKGGAADNGPVVHTTWLEGLRRFAADSFGGGAGGPPATEEIHTMVAANEYLEHHKLGTHVSRDGWYDNDTPKPVFDKNELKLWWGGDHNTGIDAKGDYVFSMKHMVPEGSYHNGLSADAQELVKEGKLKMLLSLSQGTQAHPVELPINPDGTVSVDPNSEIGKLFFSQEGGKARFLGKFAEVAELTGSRDATDHVRILATHVGEGVDEVPDVITKEVPPVPGDFLIDPPPIIPIYGRRPLEPINGVKGPNPFIPFYYGSGRPPTPEELRAYREAFSPRLRENPDATLEARREEEEYLARQTPEYLEKVQQLASQAEPMDEECKLSVCIPVAGHQEARNIARTLEAYGNQTADKKSFELVLFVNQPDVSPRGEKIESDGTLAIIEQYKKEHPELNIRILQSVLPRAEARIGNIRKLLSDATLKRSLSLRTAEDLIMVSNDADLKGVAPEYVANFIDKFKKEPKTDAFMGQMDWDPESYVRNPLVHVGTRLFQYISAQHRKDKRGIESSGANFAYRASMYAAVGGYNTRTGMGEDNEFGRKILAARRGAQGRPGIAYAGARVSRLYTSSRRAEKAIRDGLSPIEQWEKGFSAFDDEVRKVKWEETGRAPDYDNPEEVQRLVSALESIINRTLMVSSQWWSQGPYATYQRRALGWLGIKYTLVTPNRIKITDASDLIRGLKEYKEDGLRLMERKMGKRLPGEETPPKPEPQEPKDEEGVAAEKPAAEEKVAVPAAEAKPAVQEERPQAPEKASAEREQKEISLAEVTEILRAQLQGNPNVKTVRKVEVANGSDGLRFNIEVDTKLGKAAATGTVANEGNKLVTKGLEVDANLVIRSGVTAAFSDLGAATKSYFEKRDGRPVTNVQVTDKGLVVEFEGNPAARSEIKAREAVPARKEARAKIKPKAAKVAAPAEPKRVRA